MSRGNLYILNPHCKYRMRPVIYCSVCGVPVQFASPLSRRKPPRTERPQVWLQDCRFSKDTANSPFSEISKYSNGSDKSIQHLHRTNLPPYTVLISWRN